MVFRQFGHAKLNFHMATVSNLLGILQCLQGIGKKCLHFLFGLNVVLPTLIAHTVFILKFLTGLDT